MPRKARKKSQTGIYHAMLRGINRQVIFRDNEDYLKFLETMEVAKEKSGYELYAYCLMSNHAHILLKELSEDLGIIFRRIGAAYVYWYNWKYNRQGHLFQGRYRSEAVETDSYFLTVLRYIHQNPLEAGLVKDIAGYRWSSYGEYIGEQRICDTYFALDMFSTDREKALKQFKEFNGAKNQDQCLGYEQNVRLNDTEAGDYIRNISGIQDLVEIQKLKKQRRNEIIKQCRDKGLSIRQIERLTGVSFGVIRNI